MKKILFVLAVLVNILILFGCVMPSVCGNGICEASENYQNCLKDCEMSSQNYTFDGMPKETFETLVKEKMIWDLPELNGFFYAGFSASSTDIDLRYRPSVDEDQHSEYWLREFLTSEEANVDSFLVGDIVTINGNKVYEKMGQENNGVGKTRAWVSENIVLVGWNGNDVGTIYDDELFDLLTTAYLSKYPSTLKND